jgi:hypothetical protein
MTMKSSSSEIRALKRSLRKFASVSAERAVYEEKGDFQEAISATFGSVDGKLQSLIDETDSYRSHSLIIGLSFVFFLVVGFSFLYLGFLQQEAMGPIQTLTAKLVNLIGFVAIGAMAFVIGLRAVFVKDRCLRKSVESLESLRSELLSDADLEVSN